MGHAPIPWHRPRVRPRPRARGPSLSALFTELLEALRAGWREDLDFLRTAQQEGWTAGAVLAEMMRHRGTFGSPWAEEMWERHALAMADAIAAPTTHLN